MPIEPNDDILENIQREYDEEIIRGIDMPNEFKTNKDDIINCI